MIAFHTKCLVLCGASDKPVFIRLHRIFVMIKENVMIKESGYFPFVLYSTVLFRKNRARKFRILLISDECSLAFAQKIRLKQSCEIANWQQNPLKLLALQSIQKCTMVSYIK